MIEQILRNSGDGVIKQLRESFQQNDVNASGRLSRTLLSEVTKERGGYRLRVTGEGYIFRTEDGNPPNANLPTTKQIFQWTIDKGISPRFGTRESMAFLIARKIRNVGDTLFRNKGNSGVISNVINDELTNTIENKLFTHIETEGIETIAKNTDVTSL